MQRYRCLVRILFLTSILISGWLIFVQRDANPLAQATCPNPTFTAQMQMGAGGRARPIVAADFDGNGRPDLAIGNSFSLFGSSLIDNVTILLNDGVGGFSAGPGSPISIGAGPISMTTADFNNDAKADLAVASEGSQEVLKTVTILLGNGAGGFNRLTPIEFPSRPTYVLAADFNADGKRDLAVAKADDNNINILLGNGAGGFTEAPGSPIAVGTSPFFIASGNFNGDTRLDLAVANLNSRNVTILLNAGNGGFNPTPTPVSVPGLAYAVVARDFNNDGRTDLAIKNTNPGELPPSNVGRLSVMLGDGNGGFPTLAPPGSASQPTTIGFFGYIVPGDFDKDNRVDLAVATPSGSEITIWFGNGTGGFRFRQRVNTLENAYAIAIADFDGNGNQDLAVTFEGPEKVVVFLVGCGGVPNTPPTINAASALTRQQGNPGVGSPIATVSDVETPRGNLTVTATTVPNGLSINTITNTNGTINANVEALCNAAAGANTVVLTVDDGNGLQATANLTVNVTPNTPPTLGTYAATTLTVGTETNVSPSTPPSDTGSTPMIAVAASSGFAGALSVNQTTGQVTIANAGPVGTYTITVTARDNCTAPTVRTFTLTVNPVPNRAPTITAISVVRRQGNAIAPAPIANVSDPETPAGNLTVTNANPPSGITINTITNANGSITAMVAAGCTAAIGENNIQLTVTDGGNLTATAILTVIVMANTQPSLSYPAQQNVNVGGTLIVSPVAAPADNGSIASINVQSVAPSFSGGVEVSPTGVVSISNAAPFGNYTVTIRATDNCGAPTNATFTLNVGCPEITLNPATLPAGATGAAYNQTITPTGGTGSMTFSVSTGTLPPGLTLTSAGTLSGTPTRSGSFTFTIKATHSNGCAGIREYTVTINCSAISVGPANLPKGNVGKAYNQRLQASGGNPPYTFAVMAGDLAPGLSLSDSGTVSGTPVQAGTYNITVRAADATACSTQLPMQLVIDPRLATNVSSASYAEGNLTPDMITAAFGTGLATTTRVATDVPLPTNLVGTTVKVRDALGMERLAPLFFVSPTQINYLIPSGTVQGAARITFTSGDGSVSVSDVMIGAVKPGVYSADARGRGLAAATVLRVKADNTRSSEPVAQFDPVQNLFVPVPIDLGSPTDRVFLVFYGTGIRNRSALSAVRVTIGGTNVEVQYAGQQGELAGLDQINALLPRSLIARGLVDIVLTVDGQTANTVQVSFK